MPHFGWIADRNSRHGTGGTGPPKYWMYCGSTAVEMVGMAVEWWNSAVDSGFERPTSSDSGADVVGSVFASSPKVVVGPAKGLEPEEDFLVTLGIVNDCTTGVKSIDNSPLKSAPNPLSRYGHFLDDSPGVATKFPTVMIWLCVTPEPSSGETMEHRSTGTQWLDPSCTLDPFAECPG